jgi:hypothetical protein
MRLPLALALALTAFLPQTSANSVALATKTSLALDLSSTPGKACLLAWAPDGRSFYLQTYTPNPDGSLKRLHYAIALPAGTVTALDAEPDWATDTLGWQTGKTSPDDPSLAIALEQGVKQLSATSIPMGGDYERGGNPDPGMGMTADAGLAAAGQMQKVTVYTLKLKSEVIGEFVNAPLMPGYTFAWGPKGTGLIAYAQKSDGKLVFMDTTGAKRRIDSFKNVVMPAWSADGTQIAFLSNTGKNKFTLVVAAVTK